MKLTTITILFLFFSNLISKIPKNCLKTSEPVTFINKILSNKINLATYFAYFGKIVDFPFGGPIKIIHFLEGEINFNFAIEKVQENNLKDYHFYEEQIYSKSYMGFGLLMCQYNELNEVFIAKKVISLETFCNKIGMEKTSRSDFLNPNNLDLKHLFDYGNVIPIYSSGIIKKAKAKINKIEREIAIKQTLASNFFISEIYYLIKFTSSKFGINFHGCQYDNSNVYVGQEYFKNPVSINEVTERLHKKTTLKRRIKLYLDLVDMLKELRKYEIVHDNIIHQNIMIDDNLGLYLTGYEGAVKINGPYSKIGTQEYMHPLRILYQGLALPSFDLYSMAWVIFGLENENNYQGMLYLPGRFKSQKIPQKCYGENRSNDCIMIFTILVRDTFEKVYGEYNQGASVENMNLTSLLIGIIKLDSRIGTDEAHSVIKRIWEKAPDIISYTMNKMG